jgi:type IV secretory pathway VirB2 component (pilin)
MTLTTKTMGAFHALSFAKGRRKLVALYTALMMMPLEAVAKVQAAEDIFGGASNPLERFLSFLTGGFASTIAIIAVVVLGAMIIMGSDFGGFGRRVPMVIVGVGFVIFASNVVNFLTGAETSGMVWEPSVACVMQLEAVPGDSAGVPLDC